ncbi:uncharacterized protein JCM6883_002234 [Sporobolomyces salmoneus]|uniref:uncharacterized protein n=1 Tax=Sporobolomyces salmoneus TaxID=183962 RepID=UPI00316EB722
MLSSLPPELLRDIIEATVPHSFHSTTYQTRQNTLCSLALVSKRFRAIAQPLLLEIVWIKSMRTLNGFLAGSGGGGTNQKQVTCVKQALLISGFSASWSEESRKLKEMLSSVTALSMYSVPEVILSCSLTSLHLSAINWKIPRTFTLSHLETLTLYSSDVAFVSSFMDLVAFPRLRNFAFFDLPVDVLQQAAFNRLLPDLETICTTRRMWEDPASTLLHGYVDKTLIISHITLSRSWSLGQHIPLAHLLIYATQVFDEEYANSISSSLDDFASWIEKNPPSSLKTIFLDLSLQISYSPPSRLRHSVKNLARVCPEKKIEVVVEPVPRNFTVDPWISPEFVRRQKERKNQESRM